MQKRIVGLFCMLLALCVVSIFRIYYLNMSGIFAAAAQGQSKYVLSVAGARGTIYDRNRKELVNQQYTYLASVLPTPQAAAALLDITAEEERPGLMERMRAGMPFVQPVPGNNIYAKGIDLFRTPLRYGEIQLAPHVIGYLDGQSRQGAAGIERAYEQWLSEHGAAIEVHYQVDAAGRVLEGAAVGVERTGGESGDMLGGVVLTLDREYQLIVQNALVNGCEKGAAVVMDIQTGELLAMASLPVFDQNDIAASLERTDAPFINRAVSGYNIGSVFKILVSAAALEYGISPGFAYNCEGSVDIDGQIFRCNNHAVHGEVDMQRALQVSCNTYFINLARQMPEKYMLSFAQNMGLAAAAELAPGLRTQAGNLPAAAELASPAGYANFSFGQGSSLASPLQMAQAVSAVANGGYAVIPRLVKGLTEDGLQVTYLPDYSANSVMSERTSKQLRELMIGVIDGGSGRTGKPLRGGAGGKTSSAQTGQMLDGREIVHAWFAGFYPAQQPKYAIVVFVEGGESGERVAAPIFKQIADGIGGLEY